MKAAPRRWLTFIAVGCAAAAVHLSTVKCLVESAGWPPLAGNVVGWLLAFSVSFGGHRCFTFDDQGAPGGRALRRFFLLSALGFAANELAYAALLATGRVRYDVALVVVLLGIAVLTYLASRHWAFRGNRAR